jgi:hypothetical protein
MGLLDKIFNLPAISNTVNSITNSVQTSVSYAVGNATTKVSEAVSSTIGTLGTTEPFSKIAANLPSFDVISAAATKAGSVLVGGTGDLVKLQIEKEQSALMGSASATDIKNAAGVNAPSNEHLVTLKQKTAEGTYAAVVFEVMPEIVESRTVSYESVAPSQFLGAFQKYKGTDSTTWTINAKLVSRTSFEATQNLFRMQTLRGWTMPYFGSDIGNEDKLGAPPPTLILNGFRKNIIGPTPVVITSLNWNWPQDVDWLPTNVTGDDGKLTPFPAIMNIAIQLVESYSIEQFNNFSRTQFEIGDLENSFSMSRSQAQATFGAKNGVSQIVIPDSARGNSNQEREYNNYDF